MSFSGQVLELDQGSVTLTVSTLYLNIFSGLVSFEVQMMQ